MPPQRRTKRLVHLDASAVPVEAALLQRAESIRTRNAADAADSPDKTTKQQMLIGEVIATEFTSMAEELHWW